MMTTYPGTVDRIVIVTDAWMPQINGVVRTLRTTAEVLRSRGLHVEMITPQDFNTLPCPSYPSIPLSILPGEKVRKRITELAPTALHIATEGPLGWAARNFAVEMGIPFTTAYHTRFPEYVNARTHIPLGITYGYLQFFHRLSRSIMVPTPMVKRDLESHGFSNVVLWSRGVDIETFQPPEPGTRLNRGQKDWPIFLYAGRVAVEKNVEAFLKLDLPGKKWVVGDGPALESLKEQYPDAVYFGFMNQTELAKVYQQSNVFVFPSKTDTFGLVLLEAMATGLPVAAYPVSGPIDVVGKSGAGVLDEDLKSACLGALNIKSEVARQHAEKYSWQAATQMFYSNLKYIPPCVFANSVKTWTNARFLDDGAELVSHLPEEHKSLLLDDSAEGSSIGIQCAIKSQSLISSPLHLRMEEPSTPSSITAITRRLGDQVYTLSSSYAANKDMREDVLAAFQAATKEQGPSIFSWAFIAILVMAIVSRLFTTKRRRKGSFSHLSSPTSSSSARPSTASATSPDRAYLLAHPSHNVGGTP